MLRPFCTCSIVFYFCLLSFLCRFYHSRLVLFYSTVCLCIISSCVSCCVFHFPLVWILFPSRDSYYWHLLLFLVSFIVLLHIIFHAYLFVQKDLDLCGPNNVDWIKRALGPICLYLLKLFCRRTVFCGRSVFSCRFVICCRFAFCCGRSVFFLWTFLALQFSWWAFEPWFLLGFLPHGLLDMDLQKWESTISKQLTPSEVKDKRQDMQTSLQATANAWVAGNFWTHAKVEHAQCPDFISLYPTNTGGGGSRVKGKRV